MVSNTNSIVIRKKMNIVQVLLAADQARGMAAVADAEVASVETSWPSNALQRTFHRAAL